MFGPYPKGKVLISDADRDMTKKIMRIMADGCVSYDKKKLKKFTKSSFYNLFYTISFFLQKGNIWGKKFDVDGRYKVIDEKLFVRWFFDQEFIRINAPGTHISFQTPLGKTKKQVHEWSFAKHNADQKHSRKESVKKEGGSKYTFSEWARVQYLLEDLIDGDDTGSIQCLTPASRGCQVSLFFTKHGKIIFEDLTQKGFMVDWREPGVIRLAPVPLYNSYSEIWNFYEALKLILQEIKK